MEFAIFSVLLLCGTTLADLSSEYEMMKSVDGDKFKVYWTYNSTTEMMHIATEVKTTGWVGFAFTEAKSNNMKDYDACIYASNQLQDYLTNGHSAPQPESQNDCILDAATTSGGTTTLKYQRKINTGDSNDVPIKKGEIIVVWVYHPTSNSLTYHGRSSRGFAEITMISSGEATKLKAFYWKFSVALMSVAAVLFSA